MFLVTLNHNGAAFFLRSTIWSAYSDRATVFETEEAAKAGLEKARKFMKASQFKAARVVKV